MSGFLVCFLVEKDVFLKAPKDRPGGAEIAIPAYHYVQARLGYDFRSVGIFAVVKNALNAAYFGRPDPDGVYEPGRNILFGARYSF